MKHGKKWLVCSLMGLTLAASQPLSLGTPVHAPGVVEVDGQEDVTAPTTLVGDVLVRTDASGRLAVIVDEARAGMPADGIADRLFLLESERPVAEQIERRFFLASVVFRGRSVYVSAPGTSFSIDAQLGSSNDRQRWIGEDRIVLHDGIALQSRRLGSARVGIEAVTTDDLVTTYDGGGGTEGAQSCQSGGSGSSTCNRSCSFTSMGISRGDGCGITCREGYYSCCNCTWLYEASCACHKEEVNPRDPKLGVDTP